jgi:outer membrane protein assembly factor BamE (lipoprotein component of BamABCDE complex)
VRLVGKVVKWGVVAAVLLLIMGGILAAVGVGEAAESSQKGTQRAAVAYGQLRKGMSAAHVQQLVGKPEDTAAYHEFGGRTVCWY